MNFTRRVLSLVLAAWVTWPAFAAAGQDWAGYLGGPERNHFSTLAQINLGNVAHLAPAWEYHTGDPGEVQCNPLVVDGVLYGVTASGWVFAVDAATGRERWRYVPLGDPAKQAHRGLTYWAEGTDRRIFSTAGPWLFALDAASGQPVPGFGEGGQVSLKAGLGDQAQHKWVISTTPATLFEDLLIVPTRVTEGADAAPGFVRAFDVRTGKLVWTFHTIPRPDETGYDTWSADAYRNRNVGGANCWAGMAVDVPRGIVYVPTGSASPDFWGGDRRGQNLFANCLVALDARTGKRLWHFQFVHHDLWDRDLPSPPNLVTVTRAGRRIDAVAQVTKAGFVFMFDRVTGEPLFPIEEKAFPPSALVGEEAWRTQPVPLRPAPFARQTLTETDLNPYSEDRDKLLARFRAARTGAFQPFSNRNETVLFPGFDGGAEWGGAAVDPDGVLYINANEIAWMARLRDTPTQNELSHLTPGHRTYVTYCIGCHGPALLGNPGSRVPSLIGLASRSTRDAVDRLILTGRGMMPGLPTLAERDRQTVVDFLFDREKVEASGQTPAPSKNTDAFTAPYELAGYVKFTDSQGYPAISPPWGSLTAIDLNTGEQRWRISLGEFKELTAKGIPPTGTENYGGPVITEGGLLFIAAAKDGMFRAFDKKSGKLLWETELPAAGFATPSTYEVAGKQYIVVAAGGTKLGTKKGDSYIAFALP